MGSLEQPLTLLGDMSPLTILQPVRASAMQAVPSQFPPPHLPKPPSAHVASLLAPSARSFKIADNQSPMPQDRVYFTFNYFNNLNAAAEQETSSRRSRNLRAYRYIFGLEKTFDEGRGSIGIQLPLDTLTGDSTVTGDFAKPGGTSTALNDLTVFAKYVLKHNPQTGSLISAGLAVTPRDGPDTFAGANYLTAVQRHHGPALHRLSLAARPILSPWLHGDRRPHQRPRRHDGLQRRRHRLLRLPQPRPEARG